MLQACLLCQRPLPSFERCGRGATGEGRQAGAQGLWLSTLLSPSTTPRSIHNGVIAVFQRKGLPDQELFSLNEGVR